MGDRAVTFKKWFVKTIFVIVTTALIVAAVFLKIINLEATPPQLIVQFTLIGGVILGIIGTLIAACVVGKKKTSQE